MESSHGGSYGNPESEQDRRYQKYFADLNFPVTKETGAWKEKVSFLFFDFKHLSRHSFVV